MSREIYVSIDVESDGPIPGRNNLLSFGAAAFDLAAADPRKPVATFSANLELLPEATPSPSTMAFWAREAAAWTAARQDTRPASEVMPAFVAWVRALPGSPVVIGYPVTYDFMFLYWYTQAFGGLKDGEPCPYGFQGLDIKTLAMLELGVPFKSATKKRMPADWFTGAPPHTHEGLADAIGQGVLFVNIMRARKAR